MHVLFFLPRKSAQMNFRKCSDLLVKLILQIISKYKKSLLNFVLDILNHLISQGSIITIMLTYRRKKNYQRNRTESNTEV